MRLCCVSAAAISAGGPRARLFHARRPHQASALVDTYPGYTPDTYFGHTHPFAALSVPTQPPPCPWARARAADACMQCKQPTIPEPRMCAALFFVLPSGSLLAPP
eukprot:6041606-Pleurochrysis_carterae.AAC.1